MANRRGQNVQVGEFNPRGGLPDGMAAIARPDGSDAGRVAAALGGLADETGKWADQAAKIEGRRAGEIAGNDPTFRPTGSTTLRGAAFEQAATSIYADKLDANVRADVLKVYDANKGQPAQLTTALNNLEKQYRDDHVFPEIEGSFAATFKRLRTPLERASASAVDGKVQAERKTSLDESLSQRVKFIESAAASSSDKNATVAIAEEIQSLGLAADSAVRAGTMDAPSARRIVQEAKRTAVRSALVGRYDRLPDLDSKERFAEDLDDRSQKIVDRLGATAEDVDLAGARREVRRRLAEDQKNVSQAEDRATRQKEREGADRARTGALDPDWVRDNEPKMSIAMNRTLARAALDAGSDKTTDPATYADLLARAVDKPDIAAREAASAFARGKLDQRALERVYSVIDRGALADDPAWARDVRRDMIERLRPTDIQAPREAVSQLDAVTAFNDQLRTNPNLSVGEGRDLADKMVDRYRNLSAKLERSALDMPRFAQTPRDGLSAEALPAIAQRLKDAKGAGQIDETGFLAEVDLLRRWQDVTRRLGRKGE